MINTEEIRVNGTQNFMGIEIPVVEGGFGEGQKVILAKTLADIHGVRLNDVQDLIQNNIEEFEIGVDLLDLCDDNFKTDAVGLGFITSNRQKHCYVLSEQGYMLLVGFMKTDRAKEIRKNLRREYFSMREAINNSLSVVDAALLDIVHADNPVNQALAIKRYGEVVTQPLIETIETQKPMVGLAELRIDKKGCYSFTDVTSSLNLKRGQISKWAKAKGFIHKKLAEVNKAGEQYFKVYSSDGIHNQVGIKDEGLQFINNNLDEIRNVSLARG